MASVLLSTIIDCDAASAWDALRDFGALHTRLAPGFVSDCRLAGEARIVTFHNGMSVRERFVSSDDAQRRLVWSVVGVPFEHHNGAATVAPVGAGRCRFEWQADMLPDALAGDLEPMMREGLAAIKRHLEADAAALRRSSSPSTVTLAVPGGHVEHGLKPDHRWRLQVAAGLCVRD